MNISQKCINEKYIELVYSKLILIVISFRQMSAFSFHDETIIRRKDTITLINY